MPYNPSSNSLSKRINKQIALGLRLYKGESIQEVAKKIEFSINAGINRTLGFSPLEILRKESNFDPLSRKLDISEQKS